MKENKISSLYKLYRYVVDRDRIDKIYNQILKTMPERKWNNYMDYYPFHSLYNYDKFKEFQNIALYCLIYHESWISFYEKLVISAKKFIISNDDEGGDYERNIFVFGPSGEDVIFAGN